MDLLSIDDLSDGDIVALLDRSVNLFELPTPSDRLAGKIVVHVFYENSTRTLMSFAIAAERSGAVSSMTPRAPTECHA